MLHVDVALYWELIDYMVARAIMGWNRVKCKNMCLEPMEAISHQHLAPWWDDLISVRLQTFVENIYTARTDKLTNVNGLLVLISEPLWTNEM